MKKFAEWLQDRDSELAEALGAPGAVSTGSVQQAPSPFQPQPVQQAPNPFANLTPQITQRLQSLGPAMTNVMSRAQQILQAGQQSTMAAAIQSALAEYDNQRTAPQSLANPRGY
jgi:hypothetical protein